ncbi:hypothetical protein BST61_g6907 [Cercospora zeina]
MTAEPPSYSIRPATSDHAAAIRAIEESSIQKFSTIPELSHLAQPGTFTPNSLSGLPAWLSRGKVFLAVNCSASEEAEEEVVGVIATLPKDDSIFIAEISVLEEHHGKGIGSMLLNAVFEWTRGQSALKGEEVKVSLTCYRDVPWNGPWYQKKGFEVIEAERLGEEHAGKIELDREVRKLEVGGYRRCCMLWTDQQGRGA